MAELMALASPAATIIAATAAVIVTWRIGKGQLRIAEEQRNIAQQQARLADVRLQHDLYDRRYRIYESARALAVEISIEARIDDDGLFTFIRGTSDAVFLLNAELVEHLEEMRRRAIRLQFLRSVINLPEYATQRSALIDDEAHIKLWFHDEIMDLRDRFKKFLVLDNLRPDPPT